ncbi:MAG TPA: GntR family transcriptional regulator [Acidimicrobiales bacterium]|nr:GntR family transcriptional regulator [Acidimicrobiales bacterium]
MGLSSVELTGGTSSGSVYEVLRDEILRGDIAAGSWLREGTVAAHLGVSRTPVREALQRLHADGLVDLIPRRGAQVIQLSGADVEASYDVRILLEGEAARRAAEFAVADLALLRSMCSSMERELKGDASNSFDEITRLNMEFHRHIHESSCNKILPALLSGIVQVSVVLHTFRHYTQAELQRSFVQHREIVDAIEAGDPSWAQAAMNSHLLGARASLTRRLQQIDRGDVRDDAV